MRNAVNLADGFWYQHSFMSLAMELSVWGGGGRNESAGRAQHEPLGCVSVTYRVRKPSVWYVWSLLVHTHNLLHVIKAGITGDQVMKRRLVVFYDTCREEDFTFTVIAL